MPCARKYIFIYVHTKTASPHTITPTCTYPHTFLAAIHLTMNEQVLTHQLMPLIHWPLTETSSLLSSLPQEEEVALSRCTVEEVWPLRCSRPGPVAPHRHSRTTSRHSRACSQLVITETIQYTHVHGQDVHSSVRMWTPVSSGLQEFPWPE